MVQIIEENKKPTFGEKFNQGLGAGLRMGNELYQQYQQKQAQEQQYEQENEAAARMGIDLRGIRDPKVREKAFELMGQRQNQQSLELLKQQGKQNILGKKQDFLSQLFGGNAQQTQPDQMQPEETMPQQRFDPAQIPDEAIAQAAAIDPAMARELRAAKDTALRERREETKEKTGKEKQYFKLNEPKLIQLAETQNKLQQEEARYERLENLFSNPEKFPSSFTAALFSKEGQINDIAYSQLSPEAQEAIKLIIDSTSNIKDTYGARVTNFDLQTYLKKLPSLLNSPEGKMRVLRDLQIMNKLNQLHAEGIQEVFEEVGGSDKIPFSKAESIYKKKYGALERSLKDQFINPEKGTFNEMPEPQKYLGRKIKNPETGEVFISDGNEWKLFKG